MPSTAIHFELNKDILNLENLKDIQNLNIYNENVLKGFYINEEEEEVKVTVKLISEDATCNSLKSESQGLEKNGRVFKINQTILNKEWVFDDWFSTQKLVKQPF